MTPDQLKVIEDEVKIWMDSERMFTAYEISRAVKTKGVGLRHREMKETIHAAIYRRRSRSYSRTLIDVGAPERAWVYHPMSKNPHQFRPLERVGDGLRSNIRGQRPFHAKNLAPLADRDVPPSTTSQGALGCDPDGNLLLPSNELSRIGIAADQNVFVVSNPAESTLSLFGSDPNSTDPTETTKTKDNGDLLIVHEMLEFVDLDWLSGYQLSVSGQSIRISGFA